MFCEGDKMRGEKEIMKREDMKGQLKGKEEDSD